MDDSLQVLGGSGRALRGAPCDALQLGMHRPLGLVNNAAFMRSVRYEIKYAVTEMLHTMNNEPSAS